MARVNLDIPDAEEQSVFDAWAKEHSYMATIDGIPNPESKRQFFKRTLIQKIKEIRSKHYVPPDIQIT